MELALWVLFGLAAYIFVGTFVLACVDVDGALGRWHDRMPRGIAFLGGIAFWMGWPYIAVRHWREYVRRLPPTS